MATYVFDVGARVNGDDIAVLDAQVVSNHSVDTSRAIIKIVIGKNNQNSVLSLLALDQDSVSSEEL